MAKGNRAPTGPGDQDNAASSPEPSGIHDPAVLHALLADAHKHIARLQDMVADLYGRAHCVEVMNGHRSMQSGRIIFTNGTSEGTYLLLRDGALAILRGGDE